jgi:hypothetical protein
MWNCLTLKFQAFKWTISSQTRGIRYVVVNKLIRDHIKQLYGEWLLGGISGSSHHGSRSTNTTNFTENVQYVLTEFDILALVLLKIHVFWYVTLGSWMSNFEGLLVP